MANDVTFDQLSANDTLQFALIYVIQTIGEAARKVSAETRSQYPSIPWSDVVGMRHRLVHDYENVRVDIVWNVAKEELPVLIEQLNAVVPKDETAP